MISRFLKKTSFLLPALLLSLAASGGAACAQGNDYRRALRLISGKLQQRFPDLRGSVVAIKGGDLYLSLGEKDKAPKGVKLNVYREGAPFRHPATGVVLGRLEEEIGEAEIVEVRGRFSIARMARLAPGGDLAPRVGDSVRLASSKIRLAILPFVNRTKEPVSMETLTRELERQLLAGGRFDVYDVDRLQVWFIESGVATDEILKGANPIRLRNEIRADLVIGSELREIRGRNVLSARLLSLTARKEIFKAVALAGDLPFEQGDPKAQALRRGAGGARASSANPSFVLDREGVPGARGGARSYLFDGASFRGVSVADVNGDGKNEVAVIAAGAVVVYRLEGGRMRELARFDDGASDFRWLDVADMNGDGLPELYIAAYRSNELFSMVLQLRGRKFETLRRNDRTFYRLLRVRRPAKGAKLPDSEAYLLLGQKEGLDKPFEGPVHRYRWTGKNLVSVAPYALPEKMTILGFGLWDIDRDGALDVIEVGEDDRLRLFSRRGEEIYKSAEAYGAPVHAFALDDEDDGEDAKRLAVRSRVLVEDVDGDGVDEVLVIRNEYASPVVPGLGVTGGQIVSLIWDGGGLSETWRSRKVSRGVVDFALADADNDGFRDLVAATAGAEVLADAKSQIFFYRIAE